MISVIMPTHRTPPLLHATLLSVLSQSYDDFEFVVVDASQDGYFKDALDSYYNNPLFLNYRNRFSKVHIVRPDENRELPGCMKMTGFRNCTQDDDFCIFLDHDDFLYGDTLKHIHNADLLYPGKDMIGMDYTSMVYDKGMVFTNKKTFIGGEVCGTFDTLWIDNIYYKFNGEQDVYRNIHPYKSPVHPKILSKKVLRKNRFTFVEDTETMDDCMFSVMSHALSETYIKAIGYVFVGYYGSNSTSGRKVSDTVHKNWNACDEYAIMLNSIGYVKPRDVYDPFI
jgi:glycosyltransferase involved in cell wall biosynthesis